MIKIQIKSIVYVAAFWVCLSVITGETCYGNESNQTLFLEEVFQGSVPKSDYIWITPAVRPVVESILMHEYKGLRIKYWRNAYQTVWVLSDLVKGKPVCAGIVVSQEKIQRVEILSAEGRWGSLVKKESFTSQFENVASVKSNRLTRSIDGISGATLSVNAVSQLARLALALDKIRQQGKE